MDHNFLFTCFFPLTESHGLHLFCFQIGHLHLLIIVVPWLQLNLFLSLITDKKAAHEKASHINDKCTEYH